MGHDLIVRAASVSEFTQAMDHYTGTCETGAVVGWKLVKTQWPFSKILVVKRPVAEIVQSCLAKGLTVDTNLLEERAVMLEMLARSIGVHSIDFADLNEVDCCKWVFEHLLEIEFDVKWWSELRNKNIQIDFEKRVLELAMGRERLAAMTNEVIMASRKLGSGTCLDLN